MEPRLTKAKKKQYLFKEIFIGVIMGLLATCVGLLICLLVISLIKGTGIIETFTFYVDSGNLWTILTLGALPNLAAFFGFLKINKEYRARGVILATFIVAITAYIIYFT